MRKSRSRERASVWASSSSGGNGASCVTTSRGSHSARVPSCQKGRTPTAGMRRCYVSGRRGCPVLLERAESAYGFFDLYEHRWFAMIPLCGRRLPEFLPGSSRLRSISWQSRWRYRSRNRLAVCHRHAHRSGKTACLDVAIFALAAEVGTTGHDDRPAYLLRHRPPHRRGRGVFKGEADCGKLGRAKDGLLVQVADRLRTLAGPDEVPLATAILRAASTATTVGAGAHRSQRLWLAQSIRSGRACSTRIRLSPSAWPIMPG